MIDNDKLKPMVELTVADLIEERQGTFTSSVMFHGRMIAKDAGTGKILFDTRNNKREHICRFYEDTVHCMWVEMRETRKPAGFRFDYEAVLCCYVHHVEPDQEA